jgi:hypothetical protein
MTDRCSTLIPPPPVIREQLARHAREGRLLRALYKLSVRAAIERHEQSAGRQADQSPATQGASR